MIMKLVRLLAAGRSVIGLKGQESPYRFMDQRVLPRFGAEKHWHSAAVRRVPAPGRDGGPSGRAPAAGTGQALSETAGTGSSAAASAPDARQTGLGRARRWLTGRLGRLWVRAGSEPGQSALPRFDRLPVQGELTLDRVKVVRNDLSDAESQCEQRSRPQPAKASPSLPGLEESLSCDLEAARTGEPAGLLGPHRT